MAYQPRWLRKYRRKPRPVKWKLLVHDNAQAVFDRVKRNVDGD